MMTGNQRIGCAPAVSEGPSQTDLSMIFSRSDLHIRTIQQHWHLHCHRPSGLLVPMTTALQAAAVATDKGTVSDRARLPLAVLAAEVDRRMMCVVIDSFFDESLAPGLVSVRVPADSSDWNALRSAPTLGISVLNPLQTLAAGQFTRERLPKSLHRDHNGAGLVDGAAVHLTTRLYQEFDAGNHIVALLHVTGRETGEVADAQRPYLYLAA